MKCTKLPWNSTQLTVFSVPSVKKTVFGPPRTQTSQTRLKLFFEFEGGPTKLTNTVMTTKLEQNTSPYILKNENVLDKKKRHSKETEKITENKLFFCHEKVEEELFSKFGQFILCGIILYFYQDNLIWCKTKRLVSLHFARQIYTHWYIRILINLFCSWVIDHQFYN